MNLRARIEELKGKYPDLFTEFKDLQQAKGHPVENLEHFGITKQHLKRMERDGMAIKGRTPNGQIFEKEGKWFKQFGNGSKTRWLLLK